MKRRLFYFCVALLLVTIEFCGNPSQLSAPEINGVMNGQVYSIGTPGPVPEGWTPPPYEQVSTIQVIDSQKNIISEYKTDAKGTFRISVPVGFYYLHVKESLVHTETGPYQIKAGSSISVVAYYDNGMR